MSKNNGLDKVVNAVLNRVITQSMSIQQLKQDYRELSDRTNSALSSYEWFKRKIYTILNSREVANLDNKLNPENLVEGLVTVLKDLDDNHQGFLESVIAHIKIVASKRPGYDEKIGPFQQLDLILTYINQLKQKEVMFNESMAPLTATREQWGLHANLLDELCELVAIPKDLLIHEKLSNLKIRIRDIQDRVASEQAVDPRFGTPQDILSKIEFNLDRTGEEDLPLNFRLAQLEIDSENIRKMFSLCFDITDNPTGTALFTDDEVAEPIFMRIIKINKWFQAIAQTQKHYDKQLELVDKKLTEIETNLRITDPEEVNQDIAMRADHLLEYSLHIRLMLDSLHEFEKIAGFPQKQASFMARVSHLPERLRALIDDRKTLQETFESISDSFQKETATTSKLRQELIEKEAKIESLNTELFEKLQRIDVLQKQELRFHEIYNQLAINNLLPNTKGNIVEKMLAVHKYLSVTQSPSIEIVEPILESDKR